MLHKKRIYLILTALPLCVWAGGNHMDIARFSQGDFAGWKTKVFSGTTVYVAEHSDGRMAVRAESHGTASGLYREVKVSLSQTPILHWTWKIENTLSGNDERTRAGDDYPARVYVIFSGGVAFWRTRAINYVWSNRQPIDSHWLNAYTGNARMLAVESGDRPIGQWVTEQRDVRADYRRLFGEEAANIDAVAIMSDTDNTGKSAVAWYGDIWFSGEE